MKKHRHFSFLQNKKKYYILLLRYRKQLFFSSLYMYIVQIQKMLFFLVVIALVIFSLFYQSMYFEKYCCFLNVLQVLYCKVNSSRTFLPLVGLQDVAVSFERGKYSLICLVWYGTSMLMPWFVCANVLLKLRNVCKTQVAKYGN